MLLFDFGVSQKGIEEITIKIENDLSKEIDIIFNEECLRIEKWKDCSYSQKDKDKVKENSINIFCDLISKLSLTKRFYIDTKEIALNPKIVEIENDIVTLPIFFTKEKIHKKDIQDFFNKTIIDLIKSNITVSLLSL